MHAALGFLNARTRFRFTGMYRAAPPLLLNVFLFDRENPTLALGGEVRLLDQTYCGIVSATRQPFATADSQHDARLMADPARDSVVSYIGVPIRISSGHLFGTLCHFDMRPRLLPLGEVETLEFISQLVAQWVEATATAAE